MATALSVVAEKNANSAEDEGETFAESPPKSEGE